jgi:FkbM family methyltransferase
MVDRDFVRQVGFVRWATRFARLQFRKRVLGRDSRLTLPTGLTIELPRHSGSATEVYVTNADIDWGAEALFTRFADPARDLLDIGAHIGYYAAYLAPRVRRVYAFEPDPRNLPSVRANAALAGNIEVVAAAVSSRDGVAPLHVGRGSALTSLESDGTGVTVEVPVMRIDTFCAAHPEIRVALVKTDIEGHDLEALRGMAQTVTRDQPLILTECNSHQALVLLCREWRYTIFAFTRDRRTMAVSFQRMAGADFTDCWFKMLFLVPAHLEAAIAAQVRQPPNAYSASTVRT